MIREDEICLVLQGLINGVDYETGESYDFSDTVISSLKIVSTMLECDKRNKHTIDSVESANKFEEHYFEETLKTLPKISSEEYRQVNEIIGDFYLKEKLRLSKLGSNNSESKGTIADLSNQMFGINITKPRGRLSKTGWFYSGISQVKCDTCGNQLEVFRKPYTTKANLVYHYYGLVCTKCSTVITPTELLDIGDRRGLYKEHQIDVYSNNDLDLTKSNSEFKYFKIENLPKARLINLQWIGGLDDILDIRKENLLQGDLINKGVPISLEEIELYEDFVKQGKSIDDIKGYFQRSIQSLENSLSKIKEGYYKKNKTVYWNR